MEHLIMGVRDAVTKECWYPALTAALTLPDACAAIEAPGRRNNKRRYTSWIQTHFCPLVTEGARTYLTAREMYELRCAFVHEADLQIDEDDPTHPEGAEAMFEVLNEAILVVCDMPVVPSRGLREDSSGRKTCYVVAVRDLCEWLCRAAEAWLRQARLDPDKASRIGACRRIQRLNLDEVTLTPM